MNVLYINGLKGHRALSPGQRPGYRTKPTIALKGQKHDVNYLAYALAGRFDTQFIPGLRPGI